MTKPKLVIPFLIILPLTITLAVLVAILAPAPVSIQLAQPELEAEPPSLTLSTPEFNLNYQQQFTLNISYSTSQPAHFIQALIKFDPQVLKPVLPATKKHSLPLHAEKLIDNQTLRLSAAGVDPDQPGKTLAQTSGQHDLASVDFIVISEQPDFTTLELITDQENSADWESSVIVYVDKQQNPTNLLEQTNHLTLSLNQETTNSTFSLTAQEATPVQDTTPSADLATTSSASLKQNQSIPSSPSSTTSPTPTSLPFWQKLLNYFKSLF